MEMTAKCREAPFSLRHQRDGCDSVNVRLLLNSEYQHEHSGAMLPDGSHICAPQSPNTRSAGVFNTQGRAGPWS